MRAGSKEVESEGLAASWAGGQPSLSMENESGEALCVDCLQYAEKEVEAELRCLTCPKSQLSAKFAAHAPTAVSVSTFLGRSKKHR